MKQYKLIKQYPTYIGISNELLPLGAKVKWNGSQYAIQIGNRKNVYFDYEIENFPEFWEEVKEVKAVVSPYWVESFYSHEKGVMSYPFQKGETPLVEGIRRFFFTQCNISKPIHSVKRRSDNKVFTVGDFTNKGVILEFSKTTPWLVKVENSGLAEIDHNIDVLNNDTSWYYRRLQRTIWRASRKMAGYQGEELLEKAEKRIAEYEAKYLKKDKECPFTVTGWSVIFDRKVICTILRKSDGKYFSVGDQTNKGIIESINPAWPYQIVVSGLSIPVDELTAKKIEIIDYQTGPFTFYGPFTFRKKPSVWDNSDFVYHPGIRLELLNAAIDNYLSKNKDVPAEWIIEKRKLESNG